MIKCNEYDHIEIACMFNYPVRLTMKMHTIVDGIALNTEVNEHREECIKVAVDKAVIFVPLSDIVKLEIVIENPHFNEVIFS